MNRRNGFTLVELLVVIGIVGLLVAILMPSLSRAQSFAKKTACAMNLKNIGVGMTTWRTEAAINEGAMISYPAHISPRDSYLTGTAPSNASIRYDIQNVAANAGKWETTTVNRTDYTRYYSWQAEIIKKDGASWNHFVCPAVKDRPQKSYKNPVTASAPTAYALPPLPNYGMNILGGDRRKNGTDNEVLDGNSRIQVVALDYDNWGVDPGETNASGDDAKRTLVKSLMIDVAKKRHLGTLNVLHGTGAVQSATPEKSEEGGIDPTYKDASSVLVNYNSLWNPPEP